MKPILGTYAYRVRMERVAEPAPKLRGPEDAHAVARRVLEDEAQEVFLAIILNSQRQVVGYTEVSRGILDTALIHPRECFRVAILQNASAIIIAHNHPSGDPEPSREDIAVTKRLAKAGDVLGIRVLDHIIIGHGGAFESLSDHCQVST